MNKVADAKKAVADAKKEDLEPKDQLQVQTEVDPAALAPLLDATNALAPLHLRRKWSLFFRKQ